MAIRLAPMLMGTVDDSTAKIAIGIACVIVGVGVGEIAGSTVGRAISSGSTGAPRRRWTGRWACSATPWRCCW